MTDGQAPEPVLFRSMTPDQLKDASANYWGALVDRVRVIRDDAGKRRRRGAIKTMADQEREAGERIRHLYILANCPFLDGLDAAAARRVEIAERFDLGELTGCQAAVALAAVEIPASPDWIAPALDRAAEPEAA